MKTDTLERFIVKRNILKGMGKQCLDPFGLQPHNVFLSKPLAFLKILAMAINMPMLEVVVQYE
jgi:hypothetical protein